MATPLSGNDGFANIASPGYCVTVGGLPHYTFPYAVAIWEHCGLDSTIKGWTVPLPSQPTSYALALSQHHKVTTDRAL